MSGGIDLLRLRMNKQRAEARQKALGELIMLKQRIQNAIESFEKNELVEETLIQNAMGITRHIIQYNQALEVLPYLADNE